MPKVLFITERFPPDIGGLSTSAARICRSLSAIPELSVDVFAWSRHIPAGRLVEEDLSDKLRLFRYGLYRHMDMTMSSSLSFLDWLHAQNNYEAVWGHYLTPTGFLAVWFAQNHGLKSLVSARGNDLDKEIFPPGDLSRLQWTLERADIVTAVSDDLKRKIQVLCKRDDVYVLRNSVDTSVFSPGIKGSDQLRQELGIGDDETVLGFTGELREKKGCQFLLEALSQVRQNSPACLLVIGEVRSFQRPALQIYAAEFPEDSQRLIVTGHLDQPEMVAKYLQLCDVYLQPSILEGIPNSLLEAMSCSKLCISSDAGGIPEVVDHQTNGFILPRAQLNNLGTAVLEAIALDDDEKKAIGINARKKIEGDFSLQLERDHLEKIFSRLLSTSS